MAVKMIVAVAIALTVSACAQQGGGPTMPTPSTPPPSSSDSPSPSPSLSPRPSLTPKPTSGSASLRGVVEEGVEAGCLMLNVDGTLYQLIGGDRTLLRPGRRVAVLGDIQRDLATTCQQGIPLVVRQASAA